MHPLIETLDDVPDSKIPEFGAQEHHLLTVFPQSIALVMPRVSGEEREILKSIGDEAVREHVSFCNAAHSASRDPIYSVKAYRDWHQNTMLHSPLPYALGALFVMYGNSMSQSERVNALLGPYRVRHDLIVDGANASRKYTERVWDEVYLGLVGKERTHAVG